MAGRSLSTKALATVGAVHTKSEADLPVLARGHREHAAMLRVGFNLWRGMADEAN